MAEPAKTSYSTDPALYIYTSLTAGSSHIVTATSRLETILRANRVPFKAIDVATDEKARMLWGRRAGKDESGRLRKLPGLVQMGMVLGDLVEIEDWNEYGELKQHVQIYYDDFTTPSKNAAPPLNLLKKPGPLKPNAGGSQSASSLSASSSAPGSGVKPVPEAPPLPEPKAKTIGTEQPKKPAGGVAPSVAAAVTTPLRSIAEEAAAKGKQVRLESLREKVYGKKDKDKEAAAKGASGESGSKDAAVDEKKTVAEGDKTEVPAPLTKEPSTDSAIAAITGSISTLSIASPPGEKSAGAAGLQSPTTGAWKSSSMDDHLRQVLQSPTSGTWKAGEGPGAPAVSEHRGGIVASVPEEQIAAVEQVLTIPEVPHEDEDEEEDEEEDDDDEEEEESSSEEEEEDEEEKKLDDTKK
ncbi:uncharacterized protein BCR38DRAFT_429784 [Pseudomassariella vexata]|uniref:Thioredoxin-like protein n=1 Tax=Pseudomassariella vexata TaxID=1141098 RepID=A0A1Y2E428_9PEZI|nr:uncharacterized protein BCR38DRAFT_429784 [Pseudomassariella vexata]ORY66282.1 hypothetical protein BCR38DRAFT_429784 [Pseudomassariella vexata]